MNIEQLKKVPSKDLKEKVFKIPGKELKARKLESQNAVSLSEKDNNDAWILSNRYFDDVRDNN